MSHGQDVPDAGLSYLPADTSVAVLDITVADPLGRAAAVRGTRTALVEGLPGGGGRRWSYQGLLDDARVIVVRSPNERSSPTMSSTPGPRPLENRRHTGRCWWNWFEAKWQCANDCPVCREPDFEVGEEPDTARTRTVDRSTTA